MIYYKIPRGQLVFGSGAGACPRAARQCVIYYVVATDDRHYSDAFSYWYEGKGGNLQRVSKLEILVMCGKLYKEKEKEVA